MIMAENVVGRAEPSLKAADLLAVRSRVSWGAIAAGAMVSLAIFVLLTLLGVALGVEVAVRGTSYSSSNIGAGAAIYSILSLALAMFFGGWSTSRLAVGESKLEAILYGVILWGLLFAGLLWLVSSGVRTGFSAVVGMTTGAYSSEGSGSSAGGSRPVDVGDIEKLGLDREQAQKVRDYVGKMQNAPAETVRDVASQPEVQQATRQAAWWSLGGVLISMATVILGSLIGSGDLPVPVPILGVRRRTTPHDPRM
jgi:hypothetical protein